MGKNRKNSSGGATYPTMGEDTVGTIFEGEEGSATTMEEARNRVMDVVNSYANSWDEGGSGEAVAYAAMTIRDSLDDMSIEELNNLSDDEIKSDMIGFVREWDLG